MEKVAGALSALSVGRGDRVGIFAHNGMDYLLAMFGAWRLGAIVTLVNLMYADTLDDFVNDSTPKVLIYTGDHFESIDRHRSRMTSVQTYICLDGEQPSAESWPELLKSPPSPPPDPTRETDPAHISYTSGTTGKPKGAVLAHEPTARATHCIAERLRITNRDITLGPTALSSSYHLVANLLPGLHRGATVNVMSRWAPEAAWEKMDALGVTLLAANPPFLTDVLNVSRQRGRPPAKLRVGLSGGGPVPPELKFAWRDELKIPLVESYGQSELGGFVGLGFPEPFEDDRALAVGMPLPDKEVSIFDENDRQVPIGEPGEIVLRGGFMVGYWNKPEETASSFVDIDGRRYYRTADVVARDEDDFMYFVDRTVDTIKHKGYRVSASEIEAVLQEHPAVIESCVVGVPDPKVGERIKAFVVLKKDSKGVTGYDLISFCKGRLIDYKLPQYIEFRDMLPKSKVGKLLRREIRSEEMSRVEQKKAPRPSPPAA